MKKFLILWAIVIATLNMQNVSAYNDFEKVDLSWYFISSELEWWYGCWWSDKTIDWIWSMDKYSKIYAWIHKFCASKTLWILKLNKQNLSAENLDNITQTNSGEYLLLASKDLIKNIENTDLYKNFKTKNIKWYESQTDLSLFFQKYLTYDTSTSINSKLKIQWTFINPKWKSVTYDMDWNKLENNLDLKIIIVDDITLSKEKTKEEWEEEKLQKSFTQVDNIILWLQKQLDSWKIKYEVLEKKIQAINEKIEILISKTKDEMKKKVYQYLSEKLDDLLFQNNEIFKIITNNK